MTMKSRPLRGGRAQYSAEDAREGATLWASPASRHEDIGFRLVHDGAGRVVRGGGWYFSPAYARVANRYWNDPSFRFDYLGFRLARDTE
jgi:formylglycine-generating enzyme required for sulfatase activity